MRGRGGPKCPFEMKPLLVEIPASLIVEAGSPQAIVVGSSLPRKTYKELELEKCQLPDIFSQQGVTVSGEKKKLLSSYAKVELGNQTLLTVVTTFRDNKLSTIGRGFIENYKTILNGSKKLLTTEEVNTEKRRV